jgi:RNA polymerase sigma-70 factor (ECF subfamily)
MPLRATEYIKTNQDKFYRLAYSYMKNSDCALEIVQNSIEHGLEKISTLKNPELLPTWFYRIIVNECMMYFRKHKKVCCYDDLPEIPSDENFCSESEKAIDLYKAIDRLDIKYKTIIILRFFEDLKLDEIAKIAGSNVNTVKSRLYKALNLLKEDIGADYLSE